MDRAWAAAQVVPKGPRPTSLVAMAEELEFRLFGPVRAVGADGTERALGPRTERAILAMLLIQPRRWRRQLDLPRFALRVLLATPRQRARRGDLSQERPARVPTRAGWGTNGEST